MTSGRPGATPQDWLLRLLPLALLIILGLAGLRGVVATPRWNGPMHRDGLVVGLALEVVLGTLLVITIGRRSGGLDAQRADPAAVNAVAVKLRGVLIFVLSAGMIAVAVTIFFGLHLHLFTAKPSEPIIRRTATATPKVTVPPLGSVRGSTFHIPVAALLYASLVVVLLAGVVLSIWWARRLRPSIAPREDDFIAEDSEDLREAVESGRSALRTVDDARAAIIACYVAMESSLAERGAARGIADTPDELLARAKETGIVRGAAAARLTALFYEARFSSHPLDHRQRDAAEQALDELAAALAETESAKAGPAGAGQAGNGPSRSGPSRSGPSRNGQGGRMTGPRDTQPGGAAGNAAAAREGRRHRQSLARDDAGTSHRGRAGHGDGRGRLRHGRVGRAFRGGRRDGGDRDGRAARPAAAANAGRDEEGQGKADGPDAERLLPPQVRRADRDDQPRLLQQRAKAGAGAPAGRPAGRTPWRSPVSGSGRGPQAAVPQPSRCRLVAVDRPSKTTRPKTSVRDAAEQRGIPRRTLARLIDRLEKL